MGVTIVAAIALVVANLIVGRAVCSSSTRESACRERPDERRRWEPQRPSTFVPESPSESKAYLSVRDLRVHFPTEDGLVKAVDGISFDVEPGQILGIVGESGSGKSVTSQAILGLHTGSRTEITGEIWFERQEPGRRLPRARCARCAAAEIAMIFQDPLSSLHPFYKVGAQISEAYLVHNKVSRREARKVTVEMLDRVGIPNPESRYDDYPHQFSGGMRQRAMIAMALVCEPKLLIADEPTTALDVTVQAQILELIKDLSEGVRLRDHPHHPRPRRGC